MAILNKKWAVSRKPLPVGRNETLYHRPGEKQGTPAISGTFFMVKFHVHGAPKGM